MRKAEHLQMADWVKSADWHIPHFPGSTGRASFFEMLIVSKVISQVQIGR